MHENDVDVVFLQELYETQVKQVKGIFKDYLSHSVPGINDTEIIKGKKGYGGVTVLWRKTLAKRVKPLKSNSKRLICIEFQLNNNYKFLIINEYLPNDNYRRNDVDPEFEEEMDNIE